MALPCGSRSTTRTRKPASASAAPRFTAVVVLPTPPFWLAMAMIRGQLERRVAGLQRRRIGPGVTAPASDVGLGRGVGSAGSGVSASGSAARARCDGVDGARRRPPRAGRLAVRLRLRLRAVGSRRGPARRGGRRSARAHGVGPARGSGCGTGAGSGSGSTVDRGVDGPIGPRRPARRLRRPVARRFRLADPVVGEVRIGAADGSAGAAGLLQR